MSKELKVLNQGIRVTHTGYEYDSGIRRAEVIVHELRLGDAKAVARRGEDRGGRVALRRENRRPSTNLLWPRMNTLRLTDQIFNIVSRSCAEM